MIKNYFKIAWRNLWKNKLFSLINIISLAIGLSAFFVIGMMVYYDFSFDKFHPDGDRIYRITTDFISPEGDSYNPGVPGPLGEKIKEDFPGVETVSPIFTFSPRNVKTKGTAETFKNKQFAVFADESYFELFSYTWLAGSPNAALSRPNKVVLTEEQANKYFPNRAPQEIMGNVLIYNDSISVQVAGIVENFKKRSDLIFEEFVSYGTAGQFGHEDQFSNENWGNTNSASQLFIKIRENSNAEFIQKKLDALAKEHETEAAVKYGRHRKFHLQPLSDVHFNPNYSIFNYSSSQASKPVLLGLGLIAIFLLVLACINFINLNTAQATQRAKEIGIRKTLGGSKKQLIFQFLGETFILTLLSAILSIILAVWLLEIFTNFIPEGLNLGLLADPVLILFLFGFLLLVTFFSGFYPALVLSHFKPVSVLKSQVFKGSDKTSLRKSLTVFQFVIAQVFIIATLFVGKQIDFMMTRDMGFKTEAIAYISTPWHESSFDKRLRFIETLKDHPQVREVSLGGSPPASVNSTSTTVNYFDGTEEINTTLQLLSGDTNFLNLYDIDLLAGRSLRNDTIREYVINETYLRRIGLENPQDAIGKSVSQGDQSYLIVGVMEDFNQRSLKTEIEPMAFKGDWSRSSFSMFRTVHFSIQNQNGSWSSVIETAEGSWNEIYPGESFHMEFMDETIKKFYEREQSMNQLLNWATGLSILISCLGLLGLVIHTTERRRKEIGIRKILGASIIQLNLLLSKDFLVLVGLAFVIAAPIAWWGLHNWLQDFAYKTNISWWIFLLSGLGMVSIAIIIITIKTISTAIANPVKSLRTE